LINVTAIIGRRACSSVPIEMSCRQQDEIVTKISLFLLPWDAGG
jgi:hypothetical protein